MGYQVTSTVDVDYFVHLLALILEILPGNLLNYRIVGETFPFQVGGT